MRIDVVTLFPDLIRDALSYSMPARAVQAGLVEIHAHDLRDHADDKHRTVDDTPYGGGSGMIFKPEPIGRALRTLESAGPLNRVVFPTPDGPPLDQSLANGLSLEPRLVFLCGHYRGVDERIRRLFVTDEISIGDYVLSGGEIPTLVLIDAVIRLIPGVLGDAESALDDSFQNGLLDCAWYTRPQEYEGLAVPDVLLGGDHKKIAAWRAENAMMRTRERRPDLLQDLHSEDNRPE